MLPTIAYLRRWTHDMRFSATRKMPRFAYFHRASVNVYTVVSKNKYSETMEGRFLIHRAVFTTRFSPYLPGSTCVECCWCKRVKMSNSEVTSSYWCSCNNDASSCTRRIMRSAVRCASYTYFCRRAILGRLKRSYCLHPKDLPVE